MLGSRLRFTLGWVRVEVSVRCFLCCLEDIFALIHLRLSINIGVFDGTRVNARASDQCLLPATGPLACIKKGLESFEAV